MVVAFRIPKTSRLAAMKHETHHLGMNEHAIESFPGAYPLNRPSHALFSKRMQEKARKRKAERYAESQEDSLKARAIDGSSTVTFSDGGEGAENAESGTESAEHLPVGEVEEKDEEASGAASTFAAENGEAGGVIPPVDREVIPGVQRYK